MRISDMIEQLIQAMVEERGVAEIQRNELAGQLRCVPSQINYVIATRFSPENGYIVESRRGGGGYIRISRVAVDGPSLLMHTIGSIGESLDAKAASAMVKNLFSEGELTKREGEMLLTLLSDGVLACIPKEERNEVRARLLKYALLSAAGNP